jgi:hypothetical protein
MKKLVYVAGPLMSVGVQATNVRRGALAALTLMRAGIDAFCPHFSWFADLFEDEPPSYERWISLDFNVLGRCDALLRLPGKSPGADREVALALEKGIPVFNTVEKVLAWAK